MLHPTPPHQQLKCLWPRTTPPPNKLFKKAVSFPKLRAPTYLRGSKGEGSKVNCTSLGWSELWWQLCVAVVPTVEVKQILVELWALHHFNCRNNNQFVKCRGDLHLTATTTYVSTTHRSILVFFQFLQKNYLHFVFGKKLMILSSSKEHSCYLSLSVTACLKDFYNIQKCINVNCNISSLVQFLKQIIILLKAEGLSW